MRWDSRRARYGFRPGRGCQEALRRVEQLLDAGYTFVVDADLKSYFDTLPQAGLRARVVTKSADGRVLAWLDAFVQQEVMSTLGATQPEAGTPQGAVISPLLANVFLHEFDEWYVRTYRIRPEWSHLSATGLQYCRKKEVGGTLMLTWYADDWVAVWNGSRARAEEIKSEISTFFAEQLQLRLSKEKTLITHIDDGFTFLGYRLQGDKRWKDGQWCLFSRVPEKAIRHFRDAVTEITSHSFTDEVAAFTALSGLIRGWGNYYAYAAESRLMDSLDAYIYQRIWRYCLEKGRVRERHYCHPLPSERYVRLSPHTAQALLSQAETQPVMRNDHDLHATSDTISHHSFE